MHDTRGASGPRYKLNSFKQRIFWGSVSGQVTQASVGRMLGEGFRFHENRLNTSFQFEAAAEGVKVDKLIIVQKRIIVFTVHSLPFGKHRGNFVLYPGDLYRLAVSVLCKHLLGRKGSLICNFL